MAIWCLENCPPSLASIWYQDDLCVSKIMPAVGENLNHTLNNWNCNYRMLGLLMCYYFYCTDNNHDLTVALMFLICFSVWLCALKLLYWRSRSMITIKDNACYPAHWLRGRENQTRLDNMACGISFRSSASGTLVPNIIAPAVGENPNTPPKSHKFLLSNVRSSDALLSLVHRH